MSSSPTIKGTDATEATEEKPRESVSEEIAAETSKDEPTANDSEKIEKISNDDENEKSGELAETEEKVDDTKTDEDVVETKSEEEEPAASKLSKNQMKRKRKAERMLELKKRRKQQEKELKLAKAKAEGRDIDAERQEMEQRREQGEGRESRNRKWEERFAREANKFDICIDCSFETQMTAKEINSLASQIRYCYAANKRSRNPSRVTVTSLQGETLEKLKNVSGFEQWANRAFECTEKDILEAHPDKSKICYLTSDATDTISSLEDGTIYVIGGIVDRNRLKRAAIDRAESIGVRTAKLPISDYLDLVTTKVLTCNHVFELMLKVSEHKGDWKKAFLDVLPTRKGAETKTEG